MSSHDNKPNTIIGWILFRKKNTYVKNEKSNLNIITTILKFVINCEVLDLEKSFQSTYFGHVFCKAHHIATRDVKVYMNFKYVLLCLHKHICKSALVGFKTMAKVDENGIKLVMILVSTQGN